MSNSIDMQMWVVCRRVRDHLLEGRRHCQQRICFLIMEKILAWRRLCPLTRSAHYASLEKSTFSPFPASMTENWQNVKCTMHREASGTKWLPCRQRGPNLPHLRSPNPASWYSGESRLMAAVLATLKNSTSSRISSNGYPSKCLRVGQDSQHVLRGTNPAYSSVVGIAETVVARASLRMSRIRQRGTYLRSLTAWTWKREGGRGCLICFRRGTSCSVR